MWLRVLAPCVIVVASAVARAQALPPAVAAALARARLPQDALAAVVVDPEGRLPPRVWWRADAPVNPASVAKLTTTFAALDILGPGYTWKTRVDADGPIVGDTLRGNLYIRGEGDPKLVTERLWLLLRRVQGLGIRTIAGDIVLDHTAFAPPPRDPGAFDGEPLRPYNAGPDALLVNFKSIVMTFTPRQGVASVQADSPLAMDVQSSVPLRGGDCGDWRSALQADFSNPARVQFRGTYPAACGERIWPVAAADPSNFAARAIAGQWFALGGALHGRVRDGQVSVEAQPLFAVDSEPLSAAVRDINKFSNNVMAEQVFLTLGLQDGAPATNDRARGVVQQWWQRRIGGDMPAIENGSGLSRATRYTAAQLARLLQAAWASPWMPELLASLPAAGVDGTLRADRGRGITAAAHLKTGSLADVTAVAGVVNGAGGKRWIVVAVANHARAAEARPAIDALVDWAAAQP